MREGAAASDGRENQREKLNELKRPLAMPTSWRIARIGDVARIINGYPFDSELFHSSDGTPLIRIRDINRAETEVFYTGELIDTTLVKPGDVIIGMDGDFNVARWNGPIALLNQRLCLIRASSNCTEQFLAYLLPDHLKKINDLTYSTTVKHLSSFQVQKIKFPLPPESEVELIVSFLDRETAKADGLVAKYERLIELLEEKRVALITQAVTKGLNPKVPMKDSGVEWIGQIPTHWWLWRASRLFPRMGSGTTPPSQEQHWYSGNIAFITSADLRERVITEPAKTITEEALRSFSALKLYPAGSVVIAMYGATIGRVGVLGDAAAVNQACCVLGPSAKVTKDYAFHFFVGFRSDLVALAFGGGQPNISQEIIRALPIPVPPITEQTSIARYLDESTRNIDALRRCAERAIELIREHRSALITAAVTGKIDVRTYKAKDSEAVVA